MKIARHEKIIELIREYEIDTQKELADRLEEAGFKVTQATVSRDIRLLRITKAADADGKSHYVIQDKIPGELRNKYTRVLHDSLTSVDIAQNMLVIHTMPGMAMSAATALDSMHWKEILGCIAGDDTVICVSRDCAEAEKAARLLKNIVSI